MAVSRQVVPVIGGSLNGREVEPWGLMWEQPIVDDEYLAAWSEWFREWGSAWQIQRNVIGREPKWDDYPPPRFPREVYKYEIVDGRKARAVFFEVRR